MDNPSSRLHNRIGGEVPFKEIHLHLYLMQEEDKGVRMVVT